MMRRLAGAPMAAARYFSTAESVVEKAVNKGGAAASGARDTLGKRLLSLVYTKRSAIIAIRKWKEEGHTVRKYELNRIVRELRKLRRFKHALEIHEWMRTQNEMKLQPGDYAVHLDLIAKVRGLSSAEKFFLDLPGQMRGSLACSSLLHTYVQNKESSKAEALMKKMSECGFVKNCLPYNHMLSLYISTGQLEKVPGVIQELKKNTSPDVVTYNLWLSVCASKNDAESAEEIFLELKKAKIDPDWVTYGTLTNLYVKTSFPEKAACTLKEMEKAASRKTRNAYSSLMSLHTRMGDEDGVHRIWKKMKSIYRKMNDAEYTCMISSLVKLDSFEEAEKIYGEWESVSGTGDSRVSNILLAAYINKHQLETAEEFCRRMEEKGIVPGYTTWELLAWGSLERKQMDKVLDYVKKAVGSVEKWHPDERLIGEVLRNLEEGGNVEGAEEFLVILREAGHASTRIYNSLLRTYVRAGKMPLIVVERMEKDKVQPDEESRRLIKMTSAMCVAEIPKTFLRN